MNNRTWSVTKTRAGKPKVTLYENGRPVLSRPVVTVRAGNQFGRAWPQRSRTSGTQGSDDLHVRRVQGIVDARPRRGPSRLHEGEPAQR